MRGSCDGTALGKAKVSSIPSLPLCWRAADLGEVTLISSIAWEQDQA